MTTTSPTDWLQQLYQSTEVTAQSAATPPPPPSRDGGRLLSDSTVVSTTMHTGGSNASSPSNMSYSFVHPRNLAGGSDSQSSPMSTAVSTPTGSSTATGRVSKPARKRTRASRKNPTTLLNTDTKNFRAMVQRFTGGGVGVGAGGSSITGGGGGAAAAAAYNIPALYSAGFGLGQAGLQGQIGNFSQLQGAGGGSSVMTLGGMHYPANPSVGGADQFPSLHSHQHHQLLPTAQQLYTFPSSSTAEISGGVAHLSGEGEAAMNHHHPSLSAVGQVGTAGGGGDYSSTVSLRDDGGGGGDPDNNNNSLRRFMF